MANHFPVLLDEVIETLVTDLDGIYVDCTLGFAGHSSAILEKIYKQGFLIGLDLDPYALNKAKEKLEKKGNKRFSVHHASYEEFPEIFEPYKKFAGFGECAAVALKQKPGQFLPWHQDTYVGFRKEFNVPDDVEVTRYSLMLEDWHWGHYFLAGNSVLHQWKQGDFIQMPLTMHHTTCNGGIVPKLTMTITGTVTDEFLQRKKDGKFEY